MKKRVELAKCSLLLITLGIVMMSDVKAVTPEVKIAREPLIGGCSNMPPNLASRLSVEPPTFSYQTSFDSSKWSGSLRKLKLHLNNITGEIDLAATAEWDAGAILTGVGGKAAYPSHDARNIYTTKVDTKFQSTVEFKWDRLTPDQKTLLNASPINGMNDGLGKDRLNFLRGERSMEIGQPQGVFRRRDRVLGDIVNSNPMYVGAPDINLQGADYQRFYNANKNRSAAVFVGANDGMLHAFSAVDGTELFAYMPNALFSTLNQLTSNAYIHRPYVDGAIAANDARIGVTWKTVLASGMGGGAQGVFALDVTDPSNFGGGLGAIWEFSDNDDAAMGNVTGAPLIAKFRTKMKNGVPEYKYFVVVSGGLNNYKDDGVGKFDVAAPGALFLLSLDKGPTEKWQQGINYYRIDAPISNAAGQNGLSTPALVIGNDGAVRYAYAGDLQGNMWRFDFTDSAPWPSALGAAPYKPLFRARDANDEPQPITMQPHVVFAPGGGYVVLFGTGKFIEDADVVAGNFKMQSFYGIYDTLNDADKITGRSQLESRTFASANAAGSNALDVVGKNFIYGVTAGRRQGWYVDFLDSDKTGERSVTNPAIAYGRLFFNSLIPGKDACLHGGGRSYNLDALTGLTTPGDQTGFLSAIGMLGTPVLFHAGAPQIGDRSAIGKRTVKKKYATFNFGTNGAKVAPNGLGATGLPAGRFSWRELLNWQELRDAKGKI